jgi:hypothetical protein
MVFNFAVGYAGTLDLLARIRSAPGTSLLDIKTGNSAGGVWPETRLQLAAYRYAEFVGVPGDRKKYPMPEINQVFVLHLRPDRYAEGWRLVEYPVDEADFEAFGHALAIYRWKKSLRRSG